MAGGLMSKRKVKPYTKAVKDLIDKKTRLLFQAHTLLDLGIAEAAEPLWAPAAEYEELIAPLLDALGQDLEAAVHRISAASCYQKAGDLSRARRNPCEK
jgi:hypothetical protein